MKNQQRNERIRNIAIIAHVDHGKTTLVDHMFRQSGMVRDNQVLEERVMDSMDLERERGHADFGGEVERALSMADGAILLVDASEGPLPQTRFVLKKTLEAGLPVIVVVNKIDRKDARPAEVLNEVYDLFIDLDADEEQLSFPVLYAIGREGKSKRSLDDPDGDLTTLFETIVNEIPAPAFDPDAPFRMLVSDLGYSDFLGRLAVGRVTSGTAHSNDSLVVIGENGAPAPLRVTTLQVYAGLALVNSESAEAGDIIVLSGIEDVTIGDTICTRETPKPLPRINVDEPTVSMRFASNSSPFAGKEGKYVQSARIRERLFKETLRNVAIRVEDSEERDCFLVKGRGEFQMVILIETMRREGFELSVGRPEVILKRKGSQVLEPIEHVFVDCNESFTGIITEKLSLRKGRMTNLVNHGSGRVRLEFSIPSRGLIGYRDEFLTDTKGTGIMNSYFSGYESHRGDFLSRFSGSIVCDRQGVGVAYALFNLEPRGELFIVPGEPCYEGMIVGEHNRSNDINVNPCKEKKLTNMRAAGKDENVILTPVKPMTLERALHFVREDELVEVTPASIRLRKAELSSQKRHLSAGLKKKAQEEPNA